MVKLTGVLIAKAENSNNSALIIETRAMIPADAKTGTAAVPAERVSVTMPPHFDVSGLKRGKPVTVTIDAK